MTDATALPEYALSTSDEYQRFPQRYRHVTELAGWYNGVQISYQDFPPNTIEDNDGYVFSASLRGVLDDVVVFFSEKNRYILDTAFDNVAAKIVSLAAQSELDSRLPHELVSMIRHNHE